MEDSKLWLLPMIASALTWFEEFMTMLSGPFLSVGLAIGLVDMLTNGNLFAQFGWLAYLYAVSQAVGIDGQLIGASFRLGRAFHHGKIWQGIMYSFMAIALGYMAYLAGLTFGYQQSFGLTTEQALATVGIDKVSWIAQRAAVAVVLVIISGIMRYKPEKVLTKDGVKSQIEQEKFKKELAMARLETGAAQFGGILKLARKQFSIADQGAEEIVTVTEETMLELPEASETKTNDAIIDELLARKNWGISHYREYVMIVYNRKLTKNQAELEFKSANSGRGGEGMTSSELSLTKTKAVNLAKRMAKSEKPPELPEVEIVQA